MDEFVVFLMREFGWSLEYTVGLVKTLPTKKLNALMAELQYQRATENYRIASNSAMIIANWARAQPKGRNYKVSDFIGHPPRRVGAKAEPTLRDVAEKQGIIMPKEGEE